VELAKARRNKLQMRMVSHARGKESLYPVYLALLERLRLVQQLELGEVRLQEPHSEGSREVAQISRKHG